MIALLADTISEMKNFKRNALSGSTSLDGGKTGVYVQFKDECNTLLGLCRKTGHGVPRPGINSHIKNIITRMKNATNGEDAGSVIIEAMERHADQADFVGRLISVGISHYDSWSQWEQNRFHKLCQQLQ